MSLCKTLGGMTFAEMCERMTSTELNEWIAFNSLENEEYQADKAMKEAQSIVRRGR